MKDTIKVNFNFNIKGLDGKNIINAGEPANAGKMLALIFSGMSKGDIHKLMEWSRKCYHGQDVEFNAKERKDFEEYIENNDQLTVLSKEQILDALDVVKQPIPVKTSMNGND